jgi:hypothetical protein
MLRTLAELAYGSSVSRVGFRMNGRCLPKSISKLRPQIAGASLKT